jgi:hypothetical protein
MAKELAVVALQLLCLVPIPFLRCVQAGDRPRHGFSSGLDSINSFLFFRCELGLRMGYGSHCDRFRGLAFLLDDFQVQGGLIGGLEGGIGVLHELFPVFVL